MNLKKVMSAATITTDLKSATKEGIVEELVQLLMAAGRIRDLKDAREAVRVVLEREGKMSTGMQNGIAIPHGKTDRVDALVAAIGISRSGVDFQALDGQPARIFVMTLSPDTRTGPHIQFLAEISRRLSDAAVREGLLKAEKPEEVLDILGAG